MALNSERFDMGDIDDKRAKILRIQVASVVSIGLVHNRVLGIDSVTFLDIWLNFGQCFPGMNSHTIHSKNPEIF